MRRLLSRIPLAAWLVFGASLVVAIGLGVVVWRADALMRDFALERFQEQLRDDSLTLRERIKDLGPIHVENGKLFAGKAGAAELQDLLDRTVRSIHRTGGIFIGNVRVASTAVKADGTHPIGEAVNDPEILDPVLRQGRETFFYSVVTGATNVVSYQPLLDQSGAVVGMATSGSPMAFVDTMARHLRSQLLLSAGAVVLVGLVLLWLIVHVSLRPLGQQAEVLRALAQGEADRPVPGQERTDALGAIARAVVVAQQAVVRNRALEAETAAVRSQTEAAKLAALLKMADTIETETVGALTGIDRSTAELAETAATMSASASDTGRSAEGAAGAAAQALAHAQTVASAAEQLAASIREISGQVAHSSDMVRSAVTASEATRGTIAELNSKVAEIGAVADMIGEIAAKTNLLALNATIEAARAGEAGKGFAVVASEVKQLATQTARSTAEITRHIQEVRTATTASVTAVGRIEEAITGIDSIAGSIAAAVEQQGAATAEIARNVAETAGAADEMTNRITEVSAEAEQTGERANTVKGLAGALNASVRTLKESLTRVVRTATPEVDRRRLPRFVTDLACRISTAGQTPATGRVIDLSEGGASVRSPATLTPGAAGTLQIDSISVPLPCTVLSADGDVAHVAFRLDASATTALRQTIERLAPERLAPERLAPRRAA